MNAMESLFAVIESRKTTPAEDSYTCYLLEKGLDKILKKLGEECAETIVAAKNGEPEPLIGETADLLYHLAVMLSALGLSWELVEAELRRRAEKIGNRKPMRQTDRDS